MSGINRDEWLKAMQDVGLRSETDDQSALTIDEFAELFQLPRTTAQHRLQALVSKGKAVETTKVKRTTNNRLITFRAFKLEQA